MFVRVGDVADDGEGAEGVAGDGEGAEGVAGDAEGVNKGAGGVAGNIKGIADGAEGVGEGFCVGEGGGRRRGKGQIKWSITFLFCRGGG